MNNEDDLKIGQDPLDDMEDAEPTGQPGSDGADDGAADDGAANGNNSDGDADPETDDLEALDRITGKGSSVPIQRLNEVLEKSREAEQALVLSMANQQRMQQELEELRAKVSGGAKKDEQVEEPPVDLKAMNREYTSAILEGDIDKAAEVFEAMQAAIKAAIKADAVREATRSAQISIAQRSEAERIEEVAAQLFEAFPELDQQNSNFSQDMFDSFIEARDAALHKKMTVSQAMEHAMVRLSKLYPTTAAAPAPAPAPASLKGVGTAIAERMQRAKTVPPALGSAGKSGAGAELDEIDRISRLPLDKQDAAWRRFYKIPASHGSRDPLED